VDSGGKDHQTQARRSQDHGKTNPKTVHTATQSSPEATEKPSNARPGLGHETVAICGITLAGDAGQDSNQRELFHRRLLHLEDLGKSGVIGKGGHTEQWTATSQPDFEHDLIYAKDLIRPEISVTDGSSALPLRDDPAG
jgi:hypothetical protein